jgi:hypothetical protein
MNSLCARSRLTHMMLLTFLLFAVDRSGLYLPAALRFTGAGSRSFLGFVATTFKLPYTMFKGVFLGPRPMTARYIPTH